MLAEMPPIQSIPSNRRKRPFGLTNNLQLDERPDFQVQNLQSIQSIQFVQSFGCCSDENLFGETIDRPPLETLGELDIDREQCECIIQRKEQLRRFRIKSKQMATKQLAGVAKHSAIVPEVMEISSMHSPNLEVPIEVDKRQCRIICRLSQHDSKGTMADNQKKLENINGKKFNIIYKVIDISSDESSKDDDYTGSSSSTSEDPRTPRRTKRLSKLKRFYLRHKFQKVEHINHLKTERDQSFNKATGAEPLRKCSANHPVRATETNIKELDLYELHNFAINLDFSKLIKFSDILEEIERMDVKDSNQQHNKVHTHAKDISSNLAAAKSFRPEPIQQNRN
ncbi:uncharacterized protein LOC116805280 [Drosophila grimshawi]|uniref:uncharacterized protein LOC116805280 n=1 Tax=Drosophila grimshawi TaxID=7222 RepID=UPI000C86E95A|nr:uncharacterized protein LOC116805280 [Drosophila grimshawi]